MEKKRDSKGTHTRAKHKQGEVQQKHGGIGKVAGKERVDMILKERVPGKKKA